MWLGGIPPLFGMANKMCTVCDGKTSRQLSVVNQGNSRGRYHYVCVRCFVILKMSD